MLSNRRYSLLSKVPRPTDAIAYENLRSLCQDLDTNTFEHLIVEAMSPAYNYIYAFSPIEESNISLTENGIGEIEDYELREESREITKISLKVSRVAMWTASSGIYYAYNHNTLLTKGVQENN